MSNDLGRVRIAAAEFDAADGSPLVIGTDLVGTVKDPGTSYPPGPLAHLPAGPARTLLWGDDAQAV